MTSEEAAAAPPSGARGGGGAAAAVAAARRAARPGRAPSGPPVRLRGGTRKGVYRVPFDDGTTLVGYVWSAAENYWPDAAGPAPDPADPFSGASGLPLFEAAHRRLTAAGVRTPRLYRTEHGGPGAPDVAVVEDIPGGNLEALLRRDPGAAAPVLERLADMLDTLHGTGPAGEGAGAGAFGKVALVDAGGTARGRGCPDAVLDRALRDLAEAAGRDSRIAAARDALENGLRTRRAAVRPRTDGPVLIHGELGPDHVLVGPRGEPVLIDIEGLMYFDTEWEDVFLRIRFGTHYPLLRRRGPDPARLALYTLAMRLSLVAGPLRLLDGDFPDRAFASWIAEQNLTEALRLVGRTVSGR